MKLCDFTLEKRLWLKGCQYVAGVDEVGRGALAGSVVAAAVVFNSDHRMIYGVNDSKLLSEKERERLYTLIIQQAISWGVGHASVREIEKINILQASLLAMKRVVSKLTQVDYVLVDGTRVPSWQIPSCAIVHGDRKCYSIAAASIVAKVWRDRLMQRLSRRYPEYGWDNNKGYGTSVHRMAICKYGITSLHRGLFVRKVLKNF